MVIVIQVSILFAIPLMLGGLAGIFSERSGIINLALDGEMIFGAFIGAVFVRVLQENGCTWNVQVLFLLGMLISAIAGAIMSILLSVSAIKFKADQTIGGTAINLLAPALVCTFGLLFFNSEKIYPQSFAIAILNPDLPDILKIFFDKMYISTPICIVIFVLLSIWLYKSKVGMHLRACGEHPQAADSVGINVHKMRYLGSTISGALAGLAGYVYIATCCGGTAENTVAGMGFLALAIMIFGNWNPLFTALGALLFGFLKCLGVSTSSIPFLASLGLPNYFYNMIPYLVVLVVLIITRNKSGCPKAEGIPYDKGQR